MGRALLEKNAVRGLDNTFLAFYDNQIDNTGL
jgi:hypothetical protein